MMSLQVDFCGGVEEDLVGNHGLGNVDLRLAIRQVDIYAAANGLAVSGGEENVANHCTIGEWTVGDLS